MKLGDPFYNTLITVVEHKCRLAYKHKRAREQHKRAREHVHSQEYSIIQTNEQPCNKSTSETQADLLCVQFKNYPCHSGSTAKYNVSLKKLLFACILQGFSNELVGENCNLTKCMSTKTQYFH